MKMTTMTMDNSLNMNTIGGLFRPLGASAGSNVSQCTSPMQDLAYVPGSWLKAGLVAPKQKTAKTHTTASSKGSIWITLPAENVGEKILMLMMAGAAIFGICYGFATALEMIQSSPALHSLAIQ